MYDLIHQVLTGRIDGGANRLLAVALFRDARLMERIVEGQKLNDSERCGLVWLVGVRTLTGILTALSLRAFDWDTWAT